MNGHPYKNVDRSSPRVLDRTLVEPAILRDKKDPQFPRIVRNQNCFNGLPNRFQTHK